MLSSALYSLFTHDCVSSSASALVVKFADDTTVAGLIHNNDESVYRQQVESLVEWCSRNNLELNVSKTKDITVPFPTTQPLPINGAEVEIVPTFKFLGLHLSEELKWDVNTDHYVKKAQQRFFFLRRLKNFGLGRSALVKFYRAVIESVLTFSFTV